ncbi:MAG TPA: ESX secretion-associated protein EspG [Pseudonocardiaceae bacterium]|nr:ESX secretion-associated protein EspG [Pseudonocardiaceae bacterium]
MADRYLAHCVVEGWSVRHAGNGPGLEGALALMPAATLSLVEFEAAWSVLGLGTVPFPLAGPGRRMSRAQALTVLAERGLRIGDQWTACLTVLAWPDRSVDAIGGAGHQLAALAASARGVAALAVLDRGTVVLAPIRAGSLVESVVALLPVVHAGPGHELTVPVAAVRKFLAGDGPTDLVALTDAGVSPADAALLVRLAEERLRGGQFGANLADRRSGGLYRGIPVVSWFDTISGRYLMTNDGVTLTVAPADSALIAVRLHEVLDGHR